MESYLRREEFDQHVSEDFFGFFNKHASGIGQLQKRDFVTIVDTFFRRNSNISRTATEIGLVSKLNIESVELIIRANLEFS
jgi:hypothetical protein